MRGISSHQHILKLRIEVVARHGVKGSIVKVEKLNYTDTYAGVLGLIDKKLKDNSFSAPRAQDVVMPSIFGTNLQAYQQHQECRRSV